MNTRISEPTRAPLCCPLFSFLSALILLSSCTLLPAGRPSRAASGLPTSTPQATRAAAAKATYTVERGEVVRALHLNGRVAPVREKDVFFRVDGRVRDVLVKRQEAVAAGQVLADLELGAQERDLASARLDLERAQALLQGAERTRQLEGRRAQANLRMAQENLAIVRAQDPAPRSAAADARLKKARVTVKQAQAAYDPIAWRPDRGATAEAAAPEAATLDLQEAQADHDLALQAVEVHRHEVAAAAQQVEVAQVAVDALAGPTDLLLENDVKRAQLALQKLEAGITDARLVAPFAGILTSITLIEGRPVEAYAPVATVVDPSALEIRVDADGVPLAELEVGMLASITMSGRPCEALPAHITGLPEGAWQSKEDEAETAIRLAFDGPTAGYEIGDVARTTVVLERKESVLWLAPAAIRSFEGRRFVVVQEGAGQRRIDVKLGIEGEDRVEILDGLREGQTVVGQ